MIKETAKTAFTYIDRGKKDLAVLIPGWAMDQSVFDNLDLEFDYALATKISLKDFSAGLSDLAAKRPVTLIGWSLGGILGAHFMAAHPEKVKEAIFIAVRANYPSAEISKMKDFLRRNRDAYLESFYKKCFAGPAPEMAAGETDELALELDFMAENPFPAEQLAAQQKKITFVFGGKDPIVPLKEKEELAAVLPGARYIVLAKAGHDAFMDRYFCEAVERI